MELWTDVKEEYKSRTKNSIEQYHETKKHVPCGVGSSYREWDPHPLYIDHAEGAHFQDVDGNTYLDFGLNNGAGMSGHAHPQITEAITDQAEKGTLYTKPSKLLAQAAHELKKRWDCIDKVRFTNSGSESTMHAIRVARAASGKDKLLKFEGAYHGAHDYVLMSKSVSPVKMGYEKQPKTVVESDGVPEAVKETVEIAPWNDLEAVENIIRENINEIGALIVEPIVMNIGMTQPYEQFLHGLRELCDKYGIIYIFDEVKTGVKVAPGGAAEVYGVEPDLVTMAKSIGGNLSAGAFGGKGWVMDHIEHGTAHYGTYNGNPLVLRAIITQLRDVLTSDAYDHVDKLGEQLVTGYEEVMQDHGITGHVEQVNSQGVVAFTDKTIRNYRDFDQEIPQEFHENYWFSMLNRGVMPHPHSASQQWTISVQHTEDDIQSHIDTFNEIAPRLSSEQAV